MKDRKEQSRKDENKTKHRKAKENKGIQLHSYPIKVTFRKEPVLGTVGDVSNDKSQFTRKI